MDQLENKAEGQMGQDAMKDMSGGGGQSSGGGGGMDKEINAGVDKVASSEGIPSAGDGMLNKEVDSEVGKFT